MESPRDEDILDATQGEMDAAQDADDETRLETLEKVHDQLESGLNEGAETPPA